MLILAKRTSRNYCENRKSSPAYEVGGRSKNGSNKIFGRITQPHTLTILQNRHQLTAGAAHQATIPLLGALPKRLPKLVSHLSERFTNHESQTQ